LNAEALRQASEKIGNPNILVNLVSRRVRQLNAAGGTGSRPLIAETANLGAADIALQELVLDKMSWEALAELPGETTPAGRRRKRG
jgi:DNA-directed RNA polymerase subunit omega